MDVTIPAGARDFLVEASWPHAKILPLAGDASFRRYFRIVDADRQAILMDAPPPHENPRPFLNIAHYLAKNGMRAPRIFAEDADQGLVLLEDFGVTRMREYCDANATEEKAIYTQAIATLLELRKRPVADVRPYDLDEYLREARLFTEWYCPNVGLDVDQAGYEEAWQEVLQGLLARTTKPVTVLRDYHAENVMLLQDGEQGLLDFQDALIGHPAYDLVSMLQDARRDVDIELEREMLGHYLSQTGEGEQFLADYAILGAQRNAKIVGIFVRLFKRDGKPRYLSFISRVYRMMLRDLGHPALAPVKRWFDQNVPDDVIRVPQSTGEWVKG